MGLGLYVSRQVVEAHGGSLIASSQLGEGVTFTVNMPVKKASGQVSEENSAQPQGTLTP